MGRARRKNDAGGGSPDGPGELVRLQKVLAEAGIASRRHAEEYIMSGRVTVDGQTVQELGVKVDPWKQVIKVDGERVKQQRKVYFAVNKPPGYICTNSDPGGRLRVVDLLPPIKERLYPVGRIDEASQGLMLVTNDGELAHRLLHPRFGVPKMYRVQVAGNPTDEQLNSLREGHEFSDGYFRAQSVQRLKMRGESTFLEIVLTEGHNREIRRLLARIGHKVLWLQRVSFGPLRLGKLGLGEFRSLTSEEVQRLQDLIAGRKTVKRPPRPSSRRSQGARRSEAGSGEQASPAERPASKPTGRHSRPPRSQNRRKNSP